MDEAPMLYIGEKVGSGEGPQVDIAVDPLEGTTITAKGGANALAVIAMAPLAWQGRNPKVTYDLLNELSPTRESRRGTGMSGRVMAKSSYP